MILCWIWNRICGSAVCCRIFCLVLCCVLWWNCTIYRCRLIFCLVYCLIAWRLVWSLVLINSISIIYLLCRIFCLIYCLVWCSLISLWWIFCLICCLVRYILSRLWRIFCLICYRLIRWWILLRNKISIIHSLIYCLIIKHQIFERF